VNTIIISFENGEKKEYIKGVKIGDIVNDLKNSYKFDILCGKFQNQIVGYDDSIMKSGDLYLYDINTKEGNKIYEKGLTILFETCVREILGKDTDIKISYSIDKGIFCIIDKEINEKIISDIKSLMKEKVDKSIPFQKIETSRHEAIEYFKNMKRIDKVKTLSYDTSNFVTLYKFDGTYNYILGNLPHDSSVLKYFDLTMLDNGIVLRYPSIYDNGKIKKYTHHENYHNSLKEYSEWASLLNISNLGELNEAIINDNAGEIIKLSEMIQDYKLLNIAEKISLNKNDIKIVLISGPSSSGKTTTSKKLTMYLKTLGLNPHQLSLDDYFLNREDTPLDENGKPDFESLRAIDIKLFNTQIEKLLKGSKVITPTFDFISGKKEYGKRIISIDKNQPIVIEGTHALNDILTNQIKEEEKFKIYISPLTSLNINDHNRIPTTDARMLRRLIRDDRTRGNDANATIAQWQKVRLNEDEYIFPYTNEADVVLNTAFVYEMGVLKVFAEPILHTVEMNSPYYEDARRLIENLSVFFPISSEHITNDNILREFIGGSIYDER